MRAKAYTRGLPMLPGHAGRTLTPIPGSPFLTDGLGSPATTLSQGALQLRSDSRYLLTVDRESNQVSVLRIKRDGPDSPTPGPAGAQPIGIVVT